MGNVTETTFEDRVAYARRRLATAFTVEDVFTALSRSDTDVLRVLEQDMTSRPGPAETLRERIAAWHVTMVARKVLMSTQAVTAQVMRRWAVDTLAEFLAGCTDFEPDLNGQYRIACLPGLDDGAVVFEVTTFQGYDPRRFRVQVNVGEIQ